MDSGYIGRLPCSQQGPTTFFPRARTSDYSGTGHWGGHVACWRGGLSGLCSPNTFPIHLFALNFSTGNMALKPTIYKAQVELADSDRNCFESLSLTLARHPSETLERMVVRLLAYCLGYTRGLEFTKGLSTADEPALWVHSRRVT